MSYKNKLVLLKKLEQLAKEDKFFGARKKNQGEIVPSNISLEQMLKIQIMMGANIDRIKLTLEVGADVGSLLKFAKVYEKIHGHTYFIELKRLLEKYGAAHPKPIKKM